jgi:hypothetical protein
MIVTEFTRRALASRREHRKLTAEGFRRHETDWEIHRGCMSGMVIVDVKISACGTYVYTKLGRPG